ncbi:MAG: MBL fold metallo-hydrolase [Oceanicoccus sp.]
MKSNLTIATIFATILISSVCSATDNKLAVNKVEGTLSVMVLGSGGPMATSAGRASAGYLIFTDGSPRVLMDVGGGTYQRLAESGVNIKDLDTVLLSHLHIDHTGDLSSVIKTVYFHNNIAGTSRKKPINIHGPSENGIPFPKTAILQYPHTSDYVDGYYAMPNGVERYMNLFPTAISRGASKFSYTVNDLASKVNDADEQEVLKAEDGLTITAIAVDHGPVPALAFRVEYKGYSIVYSGDTGSRGPNMITIAKNADLLIYDTAITDSLPANPLFHVLHTPPTRIGEVAYAAKVKKLLLSHITPITGPRMEEVKTAIRTKKYTGKIAIAKDLQVYNFSEKK